MEPMDTAEEPDRVICPPKVVSTPVLEPALAEDLVLNATLTVCETLMQVDNEKENGEN